MSTPPTELSSDPADYPELARQTLSARLYQVWTLTVTEGLTAPQIAERLGVSVPTVQRDRAKAHLLMRDAAARAEIGQRPFDITIAYGHRTQTKTDQVAQAADRRLWRERAKAA